MFNPTRIEGGGGNFQPGSSGTVTNLRGIDGGAMDSTASGSRPGEDNSKHVVVAVAAVAAVIVLAGYVNFRVGASVGRN